jgi:hypothetical protein
MIILFNYPLFNYFVYLSLTVPLVIDLKTLTASDQENGCV